MLSAKRQKAKSNLQATQAAKSGGEVQRFVPSSQTASPDPKIAEPHGLLHEASDPPVSPAVSSELEAYSDAPAASCLGPPDFSHQPLTLQTDDELRNLLQALPTKTDIKALIDRLEETYRLELQKVKKDMQAPSDRLTTAHGRYGGPEPE